MGGDPVIVLDTHIWVWWVHADVRLSAEQNNLIQSNEANDLGGSQIGRVGPIDVALSS